MDPTLATILAAAIGGIATVVAAWLAHRQNVATKQQDPVSTSKSASTLSTVGSAGSSTESPPIAKIMDPLSLKATAGPAPPILASSTPAWAQSGRIMDAKGTTIAVKDLALVYCTGCKPDPEYLEVWEGLAKTRVSLSKIARIASSPQGPRGNDAFEKDRGWIWKVRIQYRDGQSADADVRAFHIQGVTSSGADYNLNCYDIRTLDLDQR